MYQQLSVTPLCQYHLKGAISRSVLEEQVGVLSLEPDNEVNADGTDQ
ncbi:hypothetical protein R50073_49230 (plasmid) [Maricurvus nonylphenolicus]